MALFHTILHPTDFDACSLEAFRVARELAPACGARIVAFHVVPPPAVVAEDGRVILDPGSPTPVDLWTGYRAAQAATPDVPVRYSVMVGKAGDAARMLQELIAGAPAGVLVVMGTHGRTGLRKLIWGNRAEEVLRTVPCAVLVVKEPQAGPEPGGK